MKIHLLAAVSVLFASVAACGARSQIPGGPCGGDAPSFECVVPADDPCGPPRLVAPACDASTHTFRCSADGRPYERAAHPPATCLPFSDPEGSIRSLGGSLVRVPTDDGRCLWIADQVETTAGAKLHNVAFEPDRTAPFGTCPTQASFAFATPDSIVHVEGGDDPNILVQIAAAYRFAGETHVVYRLFQVDPTAAFGVTHLGGGLGRWDPGSQRILVPGPDNLFFSTDLDLGDAALVTPDFAYIWGCPKPAGLTEHCVVARFDAQNAMTLFAGGGSWIASQHGDDGATVFDSGPWVSSVVPHPAVSGRLLQVFVSGFGSTLESHIATAPEGPWTASASPGACSLPGVDPHAFCAGPVVHEEMADPMHPGELVVSYGLGTMAPDGAALASEHPENYWTRLAWLPAP
jgi:hypothetical protein